MGKAKEIIIGILLLIVVLIGGSIYRDLLTVFWFKVEDVILYGLHQLWVYIILIAAAVFITKKYNSSKKSSM